MSEIKWVSEVKDGEETLLISAYCVMMSAAGYYIGRYCKTISGDCKGLVEPWDRDSGYFKAKPQAEQALKEGYVPDFNTGAIASASYLYNSIN